MEGGLFFPLIPVAFFFFFWVNPVTNTPGNGRMAKERGFKKRKSFSWSVCSFYLSSALSRAILFFFVLHHHRLRREKGFGVIFFPGLSQWMGYPAGSKILVFFSVFAEKAEGWMG